MEYEQDGFVIENGRLTKYKGDDECVFIPNNVTSIGRFAFSHNDRIKKVFVLPSVTRIEGGAFASCHSLIEVMLHCPIKALETYYDESHDITWCFGSRYKKGMFEDCTSLKSVTIPNSVIGIDGSAFRGCTSLESIRIPDRIAKIGQGAFEGCTSLKKVTVPMFCDMDGAFDDGCEITQRKELDFSAFPSVEEAKAREQGFAVADGQLSKYFGEETEITIPNCVTEIGFRAFQKCDFITKVIIPEGVTRIDAWAFRFCGGLTSIFVPDTVTNIGWAAFNACIHLKEFIIPSGVTKINKLAFNSCLSLMSIKIPQCVTSIGDYAFGDCESLEDIVIPDSVTHIGKGVFIRCYHLDKVIIPDGVQSIKHGTFLDCKKLTSVIIPDSVKSIGSKAFKGCTGLKTVRVAHDCTIAPDAFDEGCEIVLS